MTKPADPENEKLIKLALRLDDQLRTDESRERFTHQEQHDTVELISDRITELSELEIDELKQAGNALAFLDLIRADMQQLGLHLTGQDQEHVSTVIEHGTPPVESSESDGIDEFFGRFKILETVGQGGFARVFRAHDPLLDREVALKIPLPQSLASLESKSRFEREAKAAAMLSHPAIVPVFETGSIGVISYIASGYCDGSSLASWFAKRDCKIEIVEATLIMIQLADAVEHAHQRKVIHRDLKPANILVMNGNSSIADRIRVTDFGLAKNLGSTDATLTIDGSVLGTPAYMSPERARGEKETNGSGDIFSLGVILYELITGELAFKKPSHLETLKAIENENPPSPRSLNPEIPKDLESICLKCLEKSPSDRYATAFELSEDLRASLEGRPTSARPITFWQQLVRWARRNPAIACALSFAFLCLLVGLSLTTWKWRESTANLALANIETKRANGQFARAEEHLDRILSASDSLLEEYQTQTKRRAITPAQREFLEVVLKLCNGLAETESANQQVTDNSLNAYLQSCRVNLTLNDYEAAIESFHQATQLVDAALRHERDIEIDSATASKIITSHIDHTLCRLNLNHSKEALAAIEGARESLKRFSNLLSDEKRIQKQLQVQLQYASVLGRLKRWDEAIEVHLHISEFEQFETTPDNILFARIFGKNMINLSVAHQAKRHAIPSMVAAESAVERFKNVVKQDSRITSDFLVLGNAQLNAGVCLKSNKQLPEAAIRLQEAVNTFRPFANLVNGSVGDIEKLANCLTQLSACLREQDQLKEALLVLDEVFDLQETALDTSPEGMGIIVETYHTQSTILIEMGNIEGAEKASQKAVELATQFFSLETCDANSKIGIMNAWTGLFKVGVVKKDHDAIMDLKESYFEVLNNIIASHHSDHAVHYAVSCKSMVFRRISESLVRRENWVRALEYADQMATVPKEHCKEGYFPLVVGARMISVVLNSWQDAEASPGEEFYQYNERALAYLETAIEEQGYRGHSNLLKHDDYRTLREQERFEEVVEPLNLHLRIRK